jgi:mono/diheme cytochrome c family protein
LAATNHSEGAPHGRLSFFRRAFFFRRAALRPGTVRATAARAIGCAFLLACGLQIWTACGKKQAAGGVPDVEAGRAIFLSHCIACHNVDPSHDGSLGPAIKGSSLELLQARVMRGEYPPGYAPKRDTKIMVKLPITEEDVEKIHKFLNAP